MYRRRRVRHEGTSDSSPSRRVVLVTGGAKGIGRGVVLHLAGKGWRVVFCDVDRSVGEGLAESAGADLHFVQGDLSSESDVERVVDDALRWGGRLDAVVNNAGLADPETGPVERLSLQEWQRRLDAVR